MAIKELHPILITTRDVGQDASWKAGSVLLLNTTTGMVETANRNATAAHNSRFVGFSADDTAKTGLTMIQADPAGSNFLSGSTYVENNNAYYVGVKRDVMTAIAGDTITNPMNLEDISASGNGSNRRGCSVFSGEGARYVTDMLAWGSEGDAVQTVDADEDEASGDYAIGDLLTWSAGTISGTTGRLVKIEANDVATCRAVARIDALQVGAVSSNGVDNQTLAYITAL